jgi:hypothetical protein
MCCHSVGCGTPKSAMQVAARSFTAGHHDAVIRVYDETGNVIETHEHKGDFKEF